MRTRHLFYIGVAGVAALVAWRKIQAELKRRDDASFQAGRVTGHFEVLAKQFEGRRNAH